MSVVQTRSFLSRGRALIMLLGLCAIAGASAEPPKHYPFVAYNEGLKAQKAGGKPMMIYFGRPGCAYCERTNVEGFGHDDLRRNYRQHFVLVYVDTESGARVTLPNGERTTEAELANQYRVRMTPTFVYLNPAGQEVARLFGIQQKKDLAALDHYMASGVYKTKPFRQFLAEQK
ncbi:MAG: thioredoxin fold domain-containing protein [Pseudomonadota bacterium]